VLYRSVISLSYPQQTASLGCCENLERFFQHEVWGDLPQLSPSPIFKKPVMSQTTLQPTKAKKVLIIEDEGDMCLLLNIMLNNQEMELDHVKNITSADEYLKKEQPSVVILDNKLPDGFGVDFISYIKKNYPSIKIIMISGFDGSVKDVALENGADIFLEKPFTRQQLYSSIQELMN
jgi:two-component system, OmpR family, response regulator